MFVGRVVEYEPEPRPIPPAASEDGRERIQIIEERAHWIIVQVVESFRGPETLQPASRIELDSWMRVSGGEDYLFYARREKGRLTVRGCERSRPASRATEDLAYARSLATSSSKEARVFGTVEWEELPASVRARAGRPPRATIVLTAPGFERRVESAEDGQFEARLPPGDYCARVEVAETYTASIRRGFTVPDGRACRRLPVAVNWNGRVGGRVVDARGRPVAGVDVHCTSPDQGRSFWVPRWTRTGEDGRFAFGGLEPGEQNVRVGIDLMAPGTGATDAATQLPILRELNLDLAQQIDLGTLTLSPAVRTAIIRGVVVDGDRRPIENAVLFIGEVGREDSLTDTRTDGAGRYVFAVVPGHRYVVRFVPLSARDGHGIDTVPITAGTTPGPPPIVVRHDR